MPAGKVTLVQKKEDKRWYVGITLSPETFTPEDAIYFAQQVEKRAKEAHRRNKDDVQS